MPKIITFGTKEYTNAMNRLRASAQDYASVITYNEFNLLELLQLYPEHFFNSRGFGWWLWKPYLIIKTLNEMQADDYVIYLDATIEVLKNPLELIDTKQDIILYNNGQSHHEYCKAECYYGMKIYSPLDQLQANAAIQIYKNTEATQTFLTDYFLACSNLSLVNDEYDEQIQISKFKEHRHDQSILTNLAVEADIKLKASPCQWGRKGNAYFNHHRTI
jgi:hypothetical protein